MPRNKFGNNDDVFDMCKSLSEELKSIKANQGGNGSGTDWAEKFNDLSNKLKNVSDMLTKASNVFESLKNIKKEYEGIRITNDHLSGKGVWTKTP